MTKVFVLDRKKMTVTALMVAAFVAAVFFLGKDDTAVPVSGSAATERTINLVTGEFKSTGADGKTIEVYRWDPGTIHVTHGETVKLSLYGVNGASHPFTIEGVNIKGEVKRGKETIVTFKADKPGTYRLICHTHSTFASGGPMIGYIVVD